MTLKRGSGKGWLPTGLLPLGLSLSLATISCMILGKNLHVTKPQFSSVNNDHSACIGLTRAMHMKQTSEPRHHRWLAVVRKLQKVGSRQSMIFKLLYRLTRNTSEFWGYFPEKSPNLSLKTSVPGAAQPATSLHKRQALLDSGDRKEEDPYFSAKCSQSSGTLNKSVQ